MSPRAILADPKLCKRQYAGSSVAAYFPASNADTPPVYSFHKEFDPTLHIFGADRVSEGK